MTALETRRTDLGVGIVSSPIGLEISRDLTFNEWKTLMQTLLRTADRTLWSLGDARAYGDRFAKDYHDGVAEIDASSRLIGIGARVARGIPIARRRGQLTFEVHAIVAAEDPSEQERWLDEAERQGWNREQLAFAFVDAIPKAPVAAISARVTGSLHELLVAEAERRDMEPRALHDVALERGLRLMAAEQVAA